MSGRGAPEKSIMKTPIVATDPAAPRSTFFETHDAGSGDEIMKNIRQQMPCDAYEFVRTQTY